MGWWRIIRWPWYFLLLHRFFFSFFSLFFFSFSLLFLPFNLTQISHVVVFALTEASLKPSSTQTYIAISRMHNLKLDRNMMQHAVLSLILSISPCFCLQSSPFLLHQRRVLNDCCCLLGLPVLVFYCIKNASQSKTGLSWWWWESLEQSGRCFCLVLDVTRYAASSKHLQIFFLCKAWLLKI